MSETEARIEVPEEMLREHALYGRIPGPIWPDDCGHGGYVCSFEDVYSGADKQLRVESIDLYVFGESSKQQVCLRFGRHGDYYSPTSIIELAKSAYQVSPYQRALQLLLVLGVVEWRPKNGS